MTLASRTMTARFAAAAVADSEMAAKSVLWQAKAPNEPVFALAEKGSGAISRGKTVHLCHGYLSDFEYWQR